MQCSRRYPSLSAVSWTVQSLAVAVLLDVTHLAYCGPVLPPGIAGRPPVTAGSASPLPTSIPPTNRKSTGSPAIHITVVDVGGKWPHRGSSSTNSPTNTSPEERHPDDQTLGQLRGVPVGTCQRSRRDRLISIGNGQCTNATVDVGACEGGCSSREAPIQHGDYMTLQLQPDGSYAAASRTRCKCCTAEMKIREAKVVCLSGSELFPRTVRYHSVNSCSCTKCR